MRTCLGLVLLCGGWAVADPVRAGEKEDAQELVDRAIKAQGGADALTRSQTSVCTSSLTLFQSGKKTFQVERQVSLPDRLRFTLKDGRTGVLIRGLDGERGWASTGGPATPLDKETAQELRAENYVLWLATLVPLKKLDVKPTAEITVNDKPAVGVLVTRAGWPKVRLYFDKKTHLLVKIDRKARESGIDVYKEYFYGDHKTFDGVTLPTREEVWIEKNKFYEDTGRKYEFPRSLDENLFKRP